MLPGATDVCGDRMLAEMCIDFDSGGRYPRTLDASSLSQPGLGRHAFASFNSPRDPVELGSLIRAGWGKLPRESVGSSLCMDKTI